MAAGDTQPTLPLPERFDAPAAPRRRRRVWPWLVALPVVVVLLVGAAVAGEFIARRTVESIAADQARAQLSLPADQVIDVDVPGLVLPQVIAGTLDDITLSSEDVVVGDFAGDVVVTAQDVPIRGGGAMGAAHATVTVDETQLRRLMSTVQNFPADTLGIAAPNVTMSTEIGILGASLPIEAALTPSAANGDLILTPASLRLGGADLTADGLREQFGRLADMVLQDWTVCVAQYLPAGATLADVTVEGEQLVAAFDVDGRIGVDPALQKNGTCS